MEIIIGKQGTQPFPISESSVSRKHAVLSVNEANGQMILRDTNSVNGTYVLHNGQFVRITEAKVGMETTVRVGAVVTFKIKDLIKKQEPEQVNISHLRTVYTNYMQNKMDIEAKTGNIMMLRITAMSMSGVLISVISILLPADILGDEKTTNIIKVCAVILSLILSWVLVDIKSRGLIRRKYENDKNFNSKYCCPKCGYHFGTKLFDNILAEGKCPNPSCRCKYTYK